MLVLFLVSALILCGIEASGEFTPTGTERRPPPVHVDEDGANFSTQPLQPVVKPSDGRNFNLKVLVMDVLTGQHLSQAQVYLYINYTRTETVHTGVDGGVLLQVPFQSGSPITVQACRNGYICKLLPYRTSKTPIFSSVTMPLLRLTQGNIWLFEDSVLITDKTSDASSQPIVQFPKSLLNLTESSDITALKAYVTVPKPPSEERDFLNTLGIMSSTLGYISMELNPVAAVCVRLFFRDTELRIGGPVKISLTLPDNCGLGSSSTVPAWLYNGTTGGWMRKGLGTVVSEGRKLSWTFSAPHLGYWIAAPVPTTGHVFGPDILGDFFVQYSSFLIVVLGGMLCVFVCLLAGLVYCHRSARRTKVTHMLALNRKDQSTTTGSNEDIEGSSQSQPNVSVSIYNGNIISNPNALATNDGIPSSNAAELIRVPTSLADSLLFYNRPVAILHTSAFFQAQDQPCWSESVDLYTQGTEKQVEEISSQNVSLSGSSAAQDQGGDTQEHVDKWENALVPTARGQFGLLESASVPETLSKMRSSRHSADAAAELSKAAPWQPPRAWFVSLEGKPAAEIRYAVAEQRRRRRAAESQDTSLDSGVDMIEVNPTPGRRAVTLERKATFVKRTASAKHTSP